MFVFSGDLNLKTRLYREGRGGYRLVKSIIILIGTWARESVENLLHVQLRIEKSRLLRY